MASLVAQANVELPEIDWFALSPVLVLIGTAVAMLVVAGLTRPWARGMYALVTVVGACTAGALAMVLWVDVSNDGPRTIVNGSLALDHLALWGTITICVAIVLAALVTEGYLRRESMDGPEVYALYLSAAVGGVVMLAANDLVVTFLGLETLSLSLYVLASSHRRRAESTESGFKYFILGGFASAFFLYGIALVYGTTGSTNISDVAGVLDAEVLLQGDDVMLLAGVALLLVGLAFKVAAVPFHFWAPDVYQGAPTPVTAFMASAGKAAAFLAMLRVLVVALPSLADDWRPVIWVLAVASLVLGSILAGVQTDVNRMLAYSSISHAGFILVGVEAAGHVGRVNDGTASSALYLLFYAVLVIGTFGVVTLVTRTGDGATDIGAFRGLASERPLLALGLTVFLVAQAGVPLTSGFIAKFGVIEAAVDVESYAIAIIAMVSAVVAAYLYLRIMVSMWLTDTEEGDTEREPVRVPLSAGIAIAAAAAFTLVFGIFPGWLIEASEQVAALAR